MCWNYSRSASVLCSCTGSAHDVHIWTLAFVSPTHVGGNYCVTASYRRVVQMMSRRTGPPDGGYGWVVVASAFFIMGLTAAVLKNFGHFFLDIQSHFGVLTSTTSWVTSTTIAMFHIGGKDVATWVNFLSFFLNLRWFILWLFYFPTAPAASALTIRFSQRVVIIAGGLLCSLGMLLASLDLSLPWLYLTMGVLEGNPFETLLLVLRPLIHLYSCFV